MGESKMGLQARLMSQALRKLTGAINKTNCSCIFINQLREKIGVMFGNPETTTGGNALKYYASVRLDIRRIGAIKEGADNIIGNRTRVKVQKNKVAPPFRQVEFDILYGEGISRAGEVLDLAVEMDIIKKAGSWFSYESGKLGQGRETVKELIKDNPELMEKLESQIRAHISGEAEAEKEAKDKAKEAKAAKAAAAASAE
jgi:recombination protein RecA